jgi:hypothetical protein
MVLVACAPALAQPRHAEVVVARDAGGRLVVHIDAAMPALLPLSHFAMLVGYAGLEPGWGSLVEDEPEHGLYTLSPLSDLCFILVSADPGAGILNDQGAALMQPGEALPFGPPPFDRHPIYNLVSTAGSVRVVAHDRAGIHADSEQVALAFVPDCYANCDGSTQEPVLNASDFVCFIGMFTGAEPNANCDGSTTTPVLNVNDFVCFLSRFAAGCG